MKENVNINAQNFAMSGNIKVQVADKQTSEVSQEFTISNHINTDKLEIVGTAITGQCFTSYRVPHGITSVFPSSYYLTVFNDPDTLDQIFKKNFVQDPVITFTTKSIQVPTSGRTINKMTDCGFILTMDLEIPSEYCNEPISGFCLSNYYSQERGYFLEGNNGNAFFTLGEEVSLAPQQMQGFSPKILFPDISSQFSFMCGENKQTGPYVLLYLAKELTIVQYDIVTQTIIQTVTDVDQWKLHTQNNHVFVVLKNMDKMQVGASSYPTQAHLLMHSYSKNFLYYYNPQPIYNTNGSLNKVISFMFEGVFSGTNYYFEKESAYYSSSYESAVDSGYKGPSRGSGIRYSYFMNAYYKSEDGKIYTSNNRNVFIMEDEFFNAVKEKIKHIGELLYYHLDESYNIDKGTPYGSEEDGCRYFKLVTYLRDGKTMGNHVVYLSLDGSVRVGSAVSCIGPDNFHQFTVYTVNNQNIPTPNIGIIPYTSAQSNTGVNALSYVKFPQEINKTNQQILKIKYEITVKFKDWLKRWMNIE